MAGVVEVNATQVNGNRYSIPWDPQFGGFKSFTLLQQVSVRAEQQYTPFRDRVTMEWPEPYPVVLDQACGHHVKLTIRLHDTVQQNSRAAPRPFLLITPVRLRSSI